MKDLTARCDQCRGPLYPVDITCNATVCVECVRRPLDKALADAVRNNPVGWSFFRNSLEAARREDGTVHACDLRPVLRGRLEPKTIATCYRVARQRGLLVEAGTERSDDHAGKNAGRWEPFYELNGEPA